jgi:transposase
MLVELSVMEQRHQSVFAVVQDGWKVSEVAERLGVSRQSVHTWIARYERGPPCLDQSPSGTGTTDPPFPSIVLRASAMKNRGDRVSCIGEEVMTMVIFLVIAGVAVCCGLCAYGIYTAVRRSRERRTDEVHVP